MIGFMPDFYPDELVYSLLARYYQRSGYLAYIHAARELYAVPTIRPDMYFINPMAEEAWEVITRGTSPEQVILGHTMYPAYARFLPVEARQAALQQMSRMEGKPYMMQKVTHRRQDRTRYLRYCPVCAEEDRKAHGEAYWHRSAQIQGIDVCPEHGCYLRDSALVVSANTLPMLVSAEEIIPQASGVAKCENMLQIELAGYVAELFRTELDVNRPVKVGAFLHSRDYGELDRVTLPKVKALVKRFLSTGNERPRRVTPGAVEQMLGLPKKQIRKLPRCKAYIGKRAEGYEQYWAREVVWAARCLITEGKLNYTGFQKKVNLDRAQFIRCIPFIAQYADEDLCRMIRETILP